MLGTAVRPREQRILSVERDGTDGAFDSVVVDLDAAIVDEARQAFPARQGVTDGFGELALLTDQTKFCPQPRFKGIDEWSTFLLPDGATFDKASASFENGVLKIAIPIDQAASQPKQISVQGQQPQGQFAQGNGKKATQPATETDDVGRQSQPQTAGAGG